MLVRQRVALVEQEADPGAGAERGETGLDLCLLRVMRFDDKYNLSDQRRQCRGITARHARRRVDDNKAILQFLRQFLQEGPHFPARQQLRDMRSATPRRQNHKVRKVRLNQYVR